ncbi:hypothetical protein MTO96_001391 [Rhipicephalus appendiculatus]|uniref:24 kDa family member n=1 Tax=Rhipicephalus appendiculatus TaxID=34631 RepID=A0A131YP80_RHIAP
MRSVCALLLAMAVATGSARRSLLDDKRVDALGVEEKPRPGSDASDRPEKPGASDCDKNKFREGINNCENGLKPLEKYLSEKKNDDSCKLLKIYLSCIEDFQLFLSCENDPASQKEMAKATSIIVKNRLNCTELAFLTANITSKLPPQNAAGAPGAPGAPGAAAPVNKTTTAATKAPLVTKKCSERKLMRRMVDCLKTMKGNLEPLLDNKKTNQKLICAQTENFKSCVNIALAHTDCNSDEEVLDQTTHFIVHVLYEHRWACKNIQTSDKKCEERSLVLKLNQCVRLLNKTVEPILEDKENNKLNICRASDTFLLCVNEAVSETACREDSEVMFHVSHFADKILRHHKWSCDQSGASSNRPRLENLRQKMDSQGSGNLTAMRPLNGAGPTGLVQADNKCNFEIVRTAVDTCQQSAYDQIKKKGISQPKHLCVELRIFKDCSIEATKKNGCASDKNAETYVYDRVKDSFYKYLTDCRPLWSAAVPLSTSTWALTLAVLMVLVQQRH